MLYDVFDSEKGVKMNLEIISIEEDKGRYRSAYLYEVKIKNSDGQIRQYLIDSNHEIRNYKRGIRFVKRKKWNYNKWQFEYALLSVLGNGNHTDDIYKYFNGIFQKQESKWKHK